MTTAHDILKHIDLYLNGDLSLAQLVDWAENTLIDPRIPEDEDVDVIMDVLMYLGAADTRGFPLTWDILHSFIQQLGGHVRVVVEPSH